MLSKARVIKRTQRSQRNEFASALTGKARSSFARVDFATNHAGVNQSLDFVAKHFSEPIQLKDLVKASKMSRRGFAKAFNKGVGVNPGVFLRSVRIEQAKWLLVEHDLKLREIAPLCGYRSENTLSVAFSRETKMSPKTFQRNFGLKTFKDQHNTRMIQ